MCCQDQPWVAIGILLLQREISSFKHIWLSWHTHEQREASRLCWRSFQRVLVSAACCSNLRSSSSRYPFIIVHLHVFLSHALLLGSCLCPTYLCLAWTHMWRSKFIFYGLPGVQGERPLECDHPTCSIYDPTIYTKGLKKEVIWGPRDNILWPATW